MSRKKKGRFTSLHHTPFESTLTPEQRQQQTQRPAGKTAHGRAHQKMLNQEAARIRREQEADKPKPSSSVQGMGDGILNAFRPQFQGMSDALRGVTDLTKEGNTPIDLTEVPPSIDCGIFGETTLATVAANEIASASSVRAAAEGENVNPKGGSDASANEVRNPDTAQQ